MKIESEMDKNLQNKVGKYGSVLKAYRSMGGWSLGVMAAGIMLIVFGVLLGLLAMLATIQAGIATLTVMAGPGLILTVIGSAKNKKRVSGYLDFFKKDTGYSEAELQEADRELMGPGAVKLTCMTDRSRRETVFIITDHDFLSAFPVQGCYLRKLDDIVAAFYSNEIPGIYGYRRNLFVISRQDIQKEGVRNEYTNKQYRGFENAILTNKPDFREVCVRAVEEMVRRAPHIITSQNISVKGIRYNLLSMNDWRKDWESIFEA